MKLQTFIVLAALVLMTLLVPGVQAQERLLFRVDIPFEFMAGGVHLLPGQYLAFHTAPLMIELVRQDGHASAWLPVKASPVMSGENSNQLLFKRYGDTYFLSGVQTGYDQQLHECYRCRAEKTLAAQYRSTEPKTVVIAAIR